VTAGNTLIVCFRLAVSTDRISSVTDNQGNSYSLAAEFASGTLSKYLAIYYAKNVAGGSVTVSINYSAGSNNLVVIAHEYSGMSQSVPFDVATVGDAATAVTTITSSSLNNNFANSLIFALAANSNQSSSFSLGTGYTNLTTDFTASGRVATEHQVTSGAPATYTANIAQSPAADVGILVAAFNDASASYPNVSDSVSVATSLSSYSDTVMSREQTTVLLPFLTITLSDSTTVTENVNTTLVHTVLKTETASVIESQGVSAEFGIRVAPTEQAYIGPKVRIV
jgi:hypothetical protein